MNNFAYNETIAFLKKQFPDQVAISVKEAAEVMNVAESTVRAAISRKVNPLPARRLTPGKIVISIPNFARWLSCDNDI